MSDKPKMNLSEQASRILRDTCFARMKVLKAGDIGSADELLKHTELGEFAARQALPVFDFFRSAMAGHEEAVRRQSAVQRSVGPHAGGEYYDGMIGDYQRIITALMQQGGYTEEDVLHLQNRVKGYVKTLKTGPARTLYIADCHFYHRRLNTEMDKRGFPSAEEMNEHMIFVLPELYSSESGETIDYSKFEVVPREMFSRQKDRELMEWKKAQEESRC